MNILPAILEHSVELVQQRLDIVEGYASWVHLDVADNMFVHGDTLSFHDLASLHTSCSVEVHLMVQNPELLDYSSFAFFSKRIIGHIEAISSPEMFVALQDHYSVEIAVALNPETDPHILEPYFPSITRVHLLSVVPGQQGSVFLPHVLEKIPVIRSMSPSVIIEVDGGVNEHTILNVLGAGADDCAVGSAIFRSPNPIESFQRLVRLAT